MIRRLLIALSVVVLSGISVTAPIAADAAPMSAPACSTAQLRLQVVVGRHDATDRYPFVVLTNRGGTCVLRGRPSVSLERSGRAVGLPGQYFPYSATGGRPRTGAVTVRHGRQASIWLAVAVASGSRCRKQAVDGFQVVVPHGSRRDAVLPRRDRGLFAVCASRSSQELDFSQFLPGGAR